MILSHQLFDLESLDFLIKKLKLKILKIPSGEINNFQYLKRISKTKKIILSTGMSNINEINQALKILTSTALIESNIVIFHCIIIPTPYKDINLYVLNEFKRRFKKRFVFSGPL